MTCRAACLGLKRKNDRKNGIERTGKKERNWFFLSLTDFGDFVDGDDDDYDYDDYDNNYGEDEDDDGVDDDNDGVNDDDSFDDNDGDHDGNIDDDDDYCSRS